MMLLATLVILAFSADPSRAEELSPPEFASQVRQFLLRPSSLPPRHTLHSQDTIQVHVFPHQERWSAPHGKELRTDRITLRSSSNCTETRSRSKEPRTQILKRTGTWTLTSIDLPATLVCEGLVQIVRSHPLPSRSYKGTLSLTSLRAPDRSRVIQAVLTLPFEEYLKGVVPAEVYSTWHGEALRAQAIAARTYASVARSGEVTPEFDVDDTVFYQAYLGEGGRQKSTDEAVDATRGSILTYDGKPIWAFFHADSGGLTENVLAVWPDLPDPTPYCQARAEAYPRDWLASEWTSKWTARALSLKLGAPVKRLIPLAQTLPSGRTSQVSVEYEDGRIELRSAVEIQQLLQLRSAWFEVQPDFTFVGRGFGHAVGMNQWGAQILASRMGWDAARILKFYYSGVEIANLASRTPGE